jgi:putative acetyltransferase
MTDATVIITKTDPRSDEAMALLKRHFAFTREHSPPGACYTFDAAELSAPEVTFWIAHVNAEPAGCAALLLRENAFAELKSLHVLDSARGAGVGRMLVVTAISAARQAGCTRMGLETGWSEGFAPSRRLYERLGFMLCDAFPPYKDGTFSCCMIRTL